MEMDGDERLHQINVYGLLNIFFKELLIFLRGLIIQGSVPARLCQKRRTVFFLKREEERE